MIELRAKIINGELYIKNDVLKSLEEKEVVVLIQKAGERRTELQNKSLHLWFDQLAKALNESGYDIRLFIKDGIDIPWSGYTVKEFLWRPLQRQFCGKKSTTQLTTSDINKIYDGINKAVSERTGLYIPFPSMENLINNNL